MKKNQLYFLLLAVFIISNGLLSCKKNETPVKPDCKIVGVVVAGSATSFTYNADGTLSSENSSTGTTRLAYNGNTITITTTTGTEVTAIKTVTLNANGLASEVITTDAAGTVLSDVVLEYNGTELVKETSTTPGGDTFVTTHTFSGGNMIASQSDTVITTLNYSNTIPAQTGDFWNLLNLVQGFETIKTKNALTSIESPGASISTINYVFDTDGKITGFNSISNGVLTSFSYQYDCN